MSVLNLDLDQLCAGACMNGVRRKVRTYREAREQYATEIVAWQIPLLLPVEPREPRVFPIDGDPIYCRDCAYDIKAKLSKLDGAACVYLRESDGLRGQTGEAKVSRSDEPASPSPTIEDIDELDGWLRSWKSAYLGCDTMARQGSLPDSITLGTSWLVVRTERILAHPDLAKPFGEEVAGWYARLRTHDPSEVVVERLKGVRCPECSGLTLERKVGEDKVTCAMPRCDRVLTLAEYRGLLEDAVAAHKRLGRNRSADLTGS